MRAAYSGALNRAGDIMYIVQCDATKRWLSSMLFTVLFKTVYIERAVHADMIGELSRSHLSPTVYS